VIIQELGAADAVPERCITVSRMPVRHTSRPQANLKVTSQWNLGCSNSLGRSHDAGSLTFRVGGAKPDYDVIYDPGPWDHVESQGVSDDRNVVGWVWSHVCVDRCIQQQRSPRAAAGQLRRGTGLLAIDDVNC
jgi:hypothetical protein